MQWKWRDIHHAQSLCLGRQIPFANTSHLTETSVPNIKTYHGEIRVCS
jgi:hypothetical protein